VLIIRQLGALALGLAITAKITLMINERFALVMLEGGIPSAKVPDPHFTRRFYNAIQGFAWASVGLCESGNLKKFESHLNVALKLFREGNETVKNGVINVYLYTVARMLDHSLLLKEMAQRCFPSELINEYNRLHAVSGL